MFVFLLFSCTEPQSIQIVYEEDSIEAALNIFVDTISANSMVELVHIDDPKDTRALQITVVGDGEEEQSYRLEGKGKELTVYGADLLGMQYGLAHALELQEFRFFHPYETRIPNEVRSFVETEEFGITHKPEMKRRGIHLHTLHPIEGYYDFWEQDDEKRAQQVGAWVIKNRGNYLQWVGLDDITENPLRMEDWKKNTRSIVDDLHVQGLEVGIGLQIYGSGNLQNAYDLIDETNDNIEEQLTDRLEPILTAAEFDVLEMSFGEFFGEEPQVFIDTLDQTFSTARSIDSDIEVGARIHVGADLVVEYNEEAQIYYFLAQYANEEIVPWVHTVMYYNLFDPANGAYHHEDFQEHQDFLFSRLQDGLPVVYFPESAYWVAFDNSVPQYLPLYIYSRWRDIYEIQKKVENTGYSSLNQHVLFSSGWEWGYWQNDVATLRMNWKIEDGYTKILEDMFSWYSETSIANIISSVAQLQYDYLIEQKLDRYICGVDAIMEFGYGTGIISQPPRPSFVELSVMETEDVLEIATQLNAFATAQQEQASLLTNITDPWIVEIADGITINVLRAQFMAQLLEHVARLDSDFSRVDDIFSRAQEVVLRRSQNAHDPNIQRLIEEGDNATIYQFGYLYRAHELCYWERERIQVRNVVMGTSEPAPGCGI